MDLKQKPLYSIRYTGLEGQTVEQALFVGSRGAEEVDWWSVYKLGNGQHLFDTYVPLLKFSISRNIQTERYVGLEVPPDDTSDVRLKEPHVVSVLTYASEGRVIREALLTCDDPKQAQLLRSYADVTREAALVEGPFQKGSEPSRTIKISFSQNYPSAPATISTMIPVAWAMISTWRTRNCRRSSALLRGNARKSYVRLERERNPHRSRW